MKYLSLIGIFFILVSCTESKEKKKPVSTANRENIKKWFNSVREQNNREVDSVTVANMEKAAINEPAEYKAMASLASGIFYSVSASYELSIKHYEKALRLPKKPAADTLNAFAYTGIGNCCKHTGDYPKALDNLYKALKIFENRNNKLGISMANAYIGEVHMQKNDFNSAKENLKIALKTLENDKGKNGWLNAAHTLANLYGMNGDYQSALKIDEEGLRIADSIKSRIEKVPFLDNKANCYMYSGQLDSAQYYFEECLKLDIASGNKKQIADTYSNLGNLASFQKDFKKAEALTLKSIAILKTVNNKFNLTKSYQILTDLYARKGEFKKALDAYITFHEEYRKMIDEKKEASLTEFKIIHETEKKEKQLAENKVELLQKNAEVRRRNNMLIVLSLLVFFILLIGFLIYRQQKLKHRQQEQEHDLKTAISQIETQNKLQNQRLAISRDLHDNIGAQLTFIISSVDNIKYAFDIKNTKLDDKLHTINSFAKDTIVELRDTIWAMNHSEIVFEDLKTRIMNFIEKAKEAKGNIRFKFSINPEINSVTLGSIPGMNIYRTIQEAVNNALKYADATEISIDIKPNGNDIRIVILDNGSGFDPETVEKGNGIGNMEKRIQDIGGKIAMESEVGKGTKISILLPHNLTGSKL
jgi:signal transduction histidine kinase